MNLKFPKLPIILFATGTLILGCSKKDKAPWINLFDSKTLTGWKQKGGAALYEVREGVIVGTTVNNTQNSFLTTEKAFDDFILELEFKVDSTMNSGIQIRSNSYDYYLNGRVHGYQIEIDPSERAWSAGIYDEGRRGWLHPLKDENSIAKNAFKQNKWNHYRIEALGDTLKTWINGIPAAHLIDDQTSMGFIGLQVHSIHAAQTAGMEVAWRNIRILTQNLQKYAQNSPLPALTKKNSLTSNELEEGWTLLWDGKTTEGWVGASLKEFPNKGWIIEDGELTVLSSGGKESAAGGDIVTLQKYGDFELMLDFKLTQGANSGIKYYVDTTINKGIGG